MSREDVKNYIWKKISFFSFEPEVLTLEFEGDSMLRLFAVGECCSHSWFEQISGEEALEKGAIILDFSFVSMGEIDTEEKYDCLRQYGLKIKTDKGYADIDMRNSSNGYYGGHISFKEDSQYVYSYYPKEKYEL